MSATSCQNCPKTNPKCRCRQPRAIDNFLSNFAAVRRFADRAEFKDVVNPADGVTYPLICSELPGWLITQVHRGLERVFARQLELNHLFMRLSPHGAPAPHQAHTDTVMGEWSAMLYLNHRQHCQGGTSILRHRISGLAADPTNPAEFAIWKQDCNVGAAWEIVKHCPMTPNRLFVFPSHLMHRAEPVGGFGSTAEDARLVLTAFVSPAKTETP